MGTEKGLVSFQGSPLIHHVIGCAAAMTQEVLVVANDDVYAQFGFPVQHDEIIGEGPLSGLVTGLRHARHDLNFVLPCDMPLLQPRLLRWLLEQYQGETAVVLSVDQRIQPLVGIYHRRALPVLEGLLAAGQLKMRIALDELHAKVLEPAHLLPGFEPDWMRNFNSKAEIHAYLQE